MNAFIDSANFSTATTVYLDSLLTTVAPDGYYSSQGYYRKQVDGKLVDILLCPEIDTVSITGVGETTATFNGNFISNGGDTSAVRGFVYGTSANPTTANSVITDTVRAQGTYSLNVTGLFFGVTYYVRAYSIIFGNTIYGDELSFVVSSCSTCSAPDITIGTQIWTGCNLDVTAYSNGDEIPQVTDPTAWVGLTTGAWCYYNNDIENCEVYGKLYNWYAVNDPRGLGPTGYHVPSDEEWTDLTTVLGGLTVAGGKMKSTGTSLWNTPNTDATNSSGFTGLPGGYRYNDGTFIDIGNYGIWWSSSEVNTSFSFNRFIGFNSGNASRNSDYKINGFSVRLIKD